jgi:pimeloyl-ACP methyl ester carboxylesterase
MAALEVLASARAAVQAVARAAVVHANEAAMLMSVVALAPLCMVGGRGESASNRSPRPKARSAPTTRPVLLVHGLAGTKSSWSLVTQTLSARGLIVDAIAYPPLGTSMERLANQLVAEVQTILSRTGADKVHLVGHSLGGVIIAQAITDGRLDGLVDTVITLGSPFGGSPWAGGPTPVCGDRQRVAAGFATAAAPRLRSRRVDRTRVGHRGRAVDASVAKRLLTNGHQGAGRGASVCQMNCLQTSCAVSRSTVSGLTRN